MERTGNFSCSASLTDFQTSVIGLLEENYLRLEKFQGSRVEAGIVNGRKSTRDSFLYDQLKTLLKIPICRWRDCDKELGIVKKDPCKAIQCRPKSANSELHHL